MELAQEPSPWTFQTDRYVCNILLDIERAVTLSKNEKSYPYNSFSPLPREGRCSSSEVKLISSPDSSDVADAS